MSSTVTQRRLDVLSLATFVALGLPDGMLGTAWPAMRASLHAPVSYLGLILLAATVGSVAITAFIGRILRRTGVARPLAAALACAAVAAAGFAVAPAIGVVIGVGVLFGLAAGTLDGGLNTAIGLSGRSRLLNLLHGFYGIGTAIGPLVVTIAIATGSWRPAYYFLLAADLVLAGLWAWTGRSGPDPDVPAPARDADPADGRGPGPAAEPWPRAVRAAVVTGIGVFFVYTGLEVAAGQWETTYGRGQLHLSATPAGLATFGYWAALTVVRIGLALPRRPPRSQSVARWGSAIALVATTIIWWQPGVTVTVLAFVLLGGSLAGIFPALIALTPARLGQERAQHVIAWQVGAAAAGAAGISALVGLAIGVSGLAVLGPSLVVLATLLVLAELLLSRLAPLRG
jgi:fucose permease